MQNKSDQVLKAATKIGETLEFRMNFAEAGTSRGQQYETI